MEMIGFYAGQYDEFRSKNYRVLVSESGPLAPSDNFSTLVSPDPLFDSRLGIEQLYLNDMSRCR